ncbi:MAG TPA: FAD-dependent oxidoreductase, partial [Armatimonadota bacterium]|nr:FAD-dependent oxidoreductase [Armatimonadota bacterium]
MSEARQEGQDGGAFSASARAEAWRRLGEGAFDLLVVGGGITGVGIAREAAGRGLSVALVEARDFGGGTSSRSSRLIHGGLRYLETFELGLVFEALGERSRLLRLAPHLVEPLSFLFPIYRSGDVGL